MDSRHYRFVFPVNTGRDIPSDFFVSKEKVFDQGLFIPQDDKRWFTERPAFPARLLLLDGTRLSVITHPSANEGEVLLALNVVHEIEMGSSLLTGWIQFRTQDRSYSIFYNTRASEAVDRFVTCVRERWLDSYPVISPPAEWSLRSFGCEPDLKFRNMLTDVLGTGESVSLQYFVESRDCPKTCFGFRRSYWYPGHLLAVTSRSRLLWLTDQYRGRWSSYAAIAISAPLWLFRKADRTKIPDRSALVLQFASTPAWRICLPKFQLGDISFLRDLERYFLSGH